MRFSRIEILFVILGGALGAIVAFVFKAGLVAASASFPPFIFVLLGLGVIELLAGLATRASPGALVGMPARMIAFVVGVGVLAAINGGLS